MGVKMKSLSKSLVLLSIMSCFGATASQIRLDNHDVVFNNNEKTKKVVTVYNIDPKTPAYVDIVVNEVLEPSLVTKSPMKKYDTPKESGLFVSPGKMAIIEGVKSETLSIININQKLDKERVYRIDVRPVISGFEKKANMSVKVLMAYDIVVHVQPDNPYIAYDYLFDDNKLMLKNTGNARFYLSNGKACNQADECTDMPKGYVYSDYTSQLSVANDTTYVSYDLVMSGQKTQHVTFKR